VTSNDLVAAILRPAGSVSYEINFACCAEGKHTNRLIVFNILSRIFHYCYSSQHGLRQRRSLFRHICQLAVSSAIGVSLLDEPPTTVIPDLSSCLKNAFRVERRCKV
jgi:hypothetical protein